MNTQELTGLKDKYGDDFEDVVALATAIVGHMSEYDQETDSIPQRNWDGAWEIIDMEYSGTTEGKRLKAFYEFLSVVRETTPTE